ncbi:hypothetical protein [Janthinobacterium sp. LB2P70]
MEASNNLGLGKAQFSMHKSNTMAMMTSKRAQLYAIKTGKKKPAAGAG